MAFSSVEPMSGIPNVAAIDSTAKLFPGSMRRFNDPALGEGWFIYLPGCASNVVGAGVTYNLGLGTTALLNGSSPADAPVAFSMSANTDPNSWSWYQASGLVAVRTNKTPAAGDLLYASPAGGLLSNNSGDGPQIANMSWVGRSAGTGLQYANVNP